MEKYTINEAQDEANIIQEKVNSGRAYDYSDAERQVENSKPITPEMLKTKILDLEPIEESRNLTVRHREQLATLVERPLLSACEELYDKNIITLDTSANKKDVEIDDWEHPGQKKLGYGAYINIDYDCLSEKNKEIGKSLGEVSFLDNRNILKITIPLTKESTFEDVQTKSQEIADKFVKQQYRVKVTTLEQMRKAYGYEPNDESLQPEDFSDERGYSNYWSPELKLFFESKEQYEKAIEYVSEE